MTGLARFLSGVSTVVARTFIHCSHPLSSRFSKFGDESDESDSLLLLANTTTPTTRLGNPLKPSLSPPLSRSATDKGNVVKIGFVGGSVATTKVAKGHDYDAAESSATTARPILTAGSALALHWFSVRLQTMIANDAKIIGSIVDPITISDDEHWNGSLRLLANIEVGS